MPELTEKEYEIMKLKATIFDLIKERDIHIQKSNYIQIETQRLIKALDEMEKKKEMK